METTNAKRNEAGLRSYLSPLGAWSLALGTSIGWGSFVMSGTLYLKEAGPMGSVIGMLLGMAVMREAEIQAFKPEIFYEVKLQFSGISAKILRG